MREAGIQRNCPEQRALPRLEVISHNEGSARYLVPEGAILKFKISREINFYLGSPFKIFFQKVFRGGYTPYTHSLPNPVHNDNL
jgi:hypothetical protein